jgi:transposase
MSPQKIRSRRAHRSAEFREEALKAVEAQPGRPIADIAKDLGIPKGTLANWHTKAERRKRAAEAAGEAPALSETEREELQRLRKENARLQMERDILKKATAFFVKESE